MKWNSFSLIIVIYLFEFLDSSIYKMIRANIPILPYFKFLSKGCSDNLNIVIHLLMFIVALVREYFQIPLNLIQKGYGDIFKWSYLNKVAILVIKISWIWKFVPGLEKTLTFIPAKKIINFSPKGWNIHLEYNS